MRVEKYDINNDVLCFLIITLHPLEKIKTEDQIHVFTRRLEAS